MDFHGKLDELLEECTPFMRREWRQLIETEDEFNDFVEHYYPANIGIQTN